ncbi:MAG: bifunctional lysine-specific demethylase and histidyl-hydroxylase [Sphingomonadales bacterium]|jgi:mannose-6-phosphate isomerase-like protein (cupin superfamily)|nr:bifunctional lysine-specific demethylase and histidyl-hydroxylase [Sphingomonadales bacterium]
MNIGEAEAILKDVLEPLPLETFFQALGRTVLRLSGSTDHTRATLLGEDPVGAVLGAYATHADRLDCHGVAPELPPPGPRKVGGASEFRKLIEDYHERDYTVHIPEVISLSPALQRFARALELLLHQPIDVSLFWSKAGAGAIVHYDNRDNLVFQLQGRKRWFVSSDEPGLQNNWRHVEEPLPHVQRHRVFDVGPGDCLYIPRGTPHTVESETESLHLAVLFVPTTLRDAVIAAVDYISDSDRAFRETAVQRADGDLDGLSSQMVSGLERLIAKCRSGDFVEAAMQHRSSRFVGDLPALSRPRAVATVSPDSLIRHAPLAISHYRRAGERLDFSLPGDHIAIHPGVEEELRFIQATNEFRIRDIPGASAIEVRVALVSRLIAAGLLEPAAAGALNGPPA